MYRRPVVYEVACSWLRTVSTDYRLRTAAASETAAPAAPARALEEPSHSHYGPHTLLVLLVL